MKTLKKILTIPESHQVHFDITLPENFPTGPAEVLLVFSPQTIQSSKTTNMEKILKLFGCLKNSPHFGGDPLAIQKELRDEWQK